MTQEQKEQYRDLLQRMARARTADAATTDKLVLAVADLLEEVERLQGELATTRVTIADYIRAENEAADDERYNDMFRAQV